MKPPMPAKTEALFLGVDRSDRSIAVCLMGAGSVLETRDIASDPAVLLDLCSDTSVCVLNDTKIYAGG